MDTSSLRVTWPGRFIPKLTPLSSICRSGVHPGFPTTLYCWRTPFDYGRKALADFQLRVFKAYIGHPNILYRGINNFENLMTYLMFNPSRILTFGPADFGIAQYFTPEFLVARNYARHHGFITVHSWPGPGSHTHKHLGEEEWKNYVKWNIARYNQDLDSMPPRVEYDFDFIEGCISRDHNTIFTCQSPVPVSKYQIAAKTSAACQYMANNMIGILYFDEDVNDISLINTNFIESCV